MKIYIESIHKSIIHSFDTNLIYIDLVDERLIIY